MESRPVACEPSPPDRATLRESGWYRIQVQGHIGACWSEWFDGLDIQPEAAGRTLLTGRVADQAALNGLLNKIYDLGLPLLSVARAEPDGKAACAQPLERT
jgi:hypothetical protein